MVFFGSCTTMMTVNAVDPNGRPIKSATVIVDGENIGKTPEASKSVTNFIGETPSIRVTAEGYQTRTVEATKELKIGPLIGGFFTGAVLFLWVWGPKAEQNVILTPIQ